MKDLKCNSICFFLKHSALFIGNKYLWFSDKMCKHTFIVRTIIDKIVYLITNSSQPLATKLPWGSNRPMICSEIGTFVNNDPWYKCGIAHFIISWPYSFP